MSEVAVWGKMHWGSFRWAIYKLPSLLARILVDLKAIDSGDVSCVWRERVETGVDPDTGKPTYSFVDHNVDVLVQPQLVAVEWLPPGARVHAPIRVYALDGLKHLDRIVWNGTEYEVKSPPQEMMIGKLFMFRVCFCEQWGW